MATIGEVMQRKVLALTLAMRLSDSPIYKAVIGYEDEENPYREKPISIYVIIGPQSMQSFHDILNAIDQSRKLSAQVYMVLGDTVEVTKESIVTDERFALKNSVSEIGPLLNDEGAPLEKTLDRIGDRINELLERLDMSIDVWDDDKDDIKVAVISRDEFNEIQEALSDAEYGM